MKIFQYSQHILGVGHFFRSLEICKALSEHEVILVTGGSPVETPLPEHTREVRLPGLMMDPDFKDLYATDQERSVNQIKEERQRILFELYEKESPDIFILELYPFGRKAFRFEIEPILEGIRQNDLPECRVVCSLRDILVEKKDTVSYESRVVRVLNSFFNALLVHSDPAIIKLDETFSSTSDITIPIVYTGFVTPKPRKNSRERLRKRLGIEENGNLLVASAGGGSVGSHLLKAVVQAVLLLGRGNNIHLNVFTGPFMSNEELEDLKSLSGDGIQVMRFTPDFLSYLSAADLSVSMAGYNTCMNILAAEVPALVWPFAQNREQRVRGETLSRLGAMDLLDDDDLHPPRLATIMEEALNQARRPSSCIDLEGATNTAKWLKTWMQTIKRD